MVRLDSLKNSDEVLTRVGYKRILWHEKTKMANVFLSVFSDGTKLVCTKNHKFILERGNEVSLANLKVGDFVLKNKRRRLIWLVNLLFTMAAKFIQKNKSVSFVERRLKQINIGLLKRVHLVAVVNLHIEREVYNLQVNSNWHEYYANGILVGNCTRYALEDEMPQMGVTPRISIVDRSKRDIRPHPPVNIKRGEEIIEIWEGDTIVGHEILKPGKVRPGILGNFR